jgi:hypothetical protein
MITDLGLGNIEISEENSKGKIRISLLEVFINILPSSI